MREGLRLDQILAEQVLAKTIRELPHNASQQGETSAAIEAMREQMEVYKLSLDEAFGQLHFVTTYLVEMSQAVKKLQAEKTVLDIFMRTHGAISCLLLKNHVSSFGDPIEALATYRAEIEEALPAALGISKQDGELMGSLKIAVASLFDPLAALIKQEIADKQFRELKPEFVN